MLGTMPSSKNSLMSWRPPVDVEAAVAPAAADTRRARRLSSPSDEDSDFRTSDEEEESSSENDNIAFRNEDSDFRTSDEEDESSPSSDDDNIALSNDDLAFVQSFSEEDVARYVAGWEWKKIQEQRAYEARIKGTYPKVSRIRCACCQKTRIVLGQEFLRKIITNEIKEKKELVKNQDATTIKQEELLSCGTPRAHRKIPGGAHASYGVWITTRPALLRTARPPTPTPLWISHPSIPQRI